MRRSRRQAHAAGLALGLKFQFRQQTCQATSFSVRDLLLQRIPQVGLGREHSSGCRLDSPLRSAADREALCGGAADGTLLALCSGHALVGEDCKQMPFGEAEAGATGPELLQP